MLGAEYDTKTAAGSRLLQWLNAQADAALKQGAITVRISEIADVLQDVMQERIDQNKDEFVKRIFNSPDVKIKELQIEMMDLDEVSLCFERDNHIEWISLGLEKGSPRYSVEVTDKENKTVELEDRSCWFMIKGIYALLMGMEYFDFGENKHIYLPAARTGFMLTKDIINKVSRQTAFNLGMERETRVPFVRPVNQFLDVMNDLTVTEKGKDAFDEIITYLESGMADGTIRMNDLPNKEVSYIPAGKETGMPLRVVSAVVTELSPLILILKHKEFLTTLFYEEPEMCLHPQLQQKMAKVICRLVNAGLHMAVTTHSDIILQHINNMIRLSNREEKEEICRQFGYDSKDLLCSEQVKVYQLKTKSDGKSEVEELVCGENGFAVPTFNDALDQIMDEAYTIQE